MISVHKCFILIALLTKMFINMESIYSCVHMSPGSFRQFCCHLLSPPMVLYDMLGTYTECLGERLDRVQWSEYL